MSTLGRIPLAEPASRDARLPHRRPTRPRHARFVVLVGACVAAAAAIALIWWMCTGDAREIQALPPARRLLLYRQTIDSLRNVCDPAAPRSLRAFCHDEADLALKFKECDSDPVCQELARRHLPQPRR